MPKVYKIEFIRNLLEIKQYLFTFMVKFKVIVQKLTSKEQYIHFCKTEPTIPVFQTFWWLDAAVGRNNWDVAIIFQENTIIGAMPYYKKLKWGATIITMPRFISMMGIWIYYPPNQKYIDKLHYEQTISTKLIEQLPSFDYFNQSFYYTYTNWLPFFWKGFKQTTRYTYTLSNLSNTEELFEKFAHSKRKNILRSEKLLTIKEDLAIKDFYDLHQKSLAKENKNIDYSFELLQNLYNASIQHNGGKILYAVDENNNIHAALFTVWNSESSFNIINPIDPEHRHSGASSLLIKQMISYIKDKTKTFDFEGSMNEQIAESFRRFGAIQKPYFVIYKANTVLGKLYTLFKN